MQVHSIISNTISEDILETGHLSIRFMADGFSLLLEDSRYKPVLLNRFSNADSTSIKDLVDECIDWLERNSILETFMGETSLVFDSAAATLVPKDLFIPESAQAYLEQLSKLKDSDSIAHKKVKGRPFYIVYAIPKALTKLDTKLKSKSRIIHSSEVIFSVADQVNAADHQRGFAYTDVQNKSMSILLISGDEVQFQNQVPLKHPEEYVYYCLNTFKQLGYDRRKSPLFYSGICQNIIGSTDSLKKYIKNVSPLSYFVHDLSKEAIIEHILLAEATRCE